MVDIHSHIAWNIDDGMPSEEDARKSLKTAQKDGITAICSTPHIVPGQTTEKQLKNIIKRQNELSAMSENIPIYKGGEIMMNENLLSAFESGILPTINGTSYMLVEYNVAEDISALDDPHELLYELSIRGVRPVMAHPERYFHKKADWDILDRWKEAGYVLQVNRNSLLGKYGRHIKKTAWQLVKRGYADCIATDCHRASGSRIEYLSDVYSLVEKKVGKEYADILFQINPQKILDGKPIIDEKWGHD